MASCADGPVLHHQVLHRKVRDVGGGQLSANADTGCCDQAVRLVQRNSLQCMIPAPTSRPPTLGAPEWSYAQPSEQSLGTGSLRVAQTAPDLLHRDRAHPWLRSCATQCRDTARRRSTSQCVDEHCRVEEDPAHSTGSLRGTRTLRTDPPGRILVPVVSRIVDAPER